MCVGEDLAVAHDHLISSTFCFKTENDLRMEKLNDSADGLLDLKKIF